MSNPHNAIADRLAALYKSQRGAQIELSHQETDLAARILAITPEGGWGGKNEGERKTARELAVASDETCKAINIRVSELRDDLADTEGEIDALREQRDALRWKIRADMVAALNSKAIAYRAVETAIEDTADHEIEERTWAFAGEGGDVDDAAARSIDQVSYPTPLYEESDIPF